MSCRIVGIHRHARRKRLRLKLLSKLPWAEWLVRKAK